MIFFLEFVTTLAAQRRFINVEGNPLKRLFVTITVCHIRFAVSTQIYTKGDGGGRAFK